jgi:hypothetical protein
VIVSPYLPTALRSGRDDKGEGGASRGEWLLNRSRFILLGAAHLQSVSKMELPLRCAPVEMAKGRAALPGESGC